MMNHRQIARELDISRDMARLGVTDGWSCKSEVPHHLKRLQDAERSGAPATLVWSKWLVLRLPVLSQ